MAEYARKPELDALRAKLVGKLIRFHLNPGRSWDTTEVGIVSRLDTYGEVYGRGSPDAVDRVILWYKDYTGRELGPHWLFPDHVEIAGADNAD